MLPFRPRGHWVVVQRDKEETTTRGGLAIPERHRVKMSRGKVLAIGDGCYENGQWITVNNLCIGDTVQWSSAGDTDITVQGEVYTFVPAASIVLVETTGIGCREEQCPPAPFRSEIP